VASQRPGPPAAGEPYPAVVRFLRYFDLALLALALPVFVVAELPLIGWVAAAIGWMCQRAIRYALDQRAAASDDPRSVAGIQIGSMVARAWLTALAIFAAGLSEREAGLAAAILVIVLFSAFFSTQMALRPYDQRPT
jgi:hypothetical protein